MGLSDVELPEYVPPTLTSCCVLSNRWVVLIGTGDRFGIFDASTETGRAYDGAGTGSGVRHVVEHGGYAWTHDTDGYVRRIDSSGAVTSWYVMGYGTWGSNPALYIWSIGDWVCGSKRSGIGMSGSETQFFGFQPSTGSHWTSLMGDFGHMLTDGMSIILSDSATRYNPATGVAIAGSWPVWPSAWMTPKINFIDGKIWTVRSAGGSKWLERWDPATGAASSVSVSDSYCRPAAGPAGRIYAASSGAVSTVDASMGMATYSFATSRTGRNAVAHAGSMYAFATETP